METTCYLPLCEEYVASGDAMHLPVGKAITLRARGIRVMEGTVWVTQEGKPTDWVLHPGEHFRSQDAGRVVAEALTPARVAMVG